MLWQECNSEEVGVVLRLQGDWHAACVWVVPQDDLQWCTVQSKDNVAKKCKGRNSYDANTWPERKNTCAELGA